MQHQKKFYSKICVILQNIVRVIQKLIEKLEIFYIFGAHIFV